MPAADPAGGDPDAPPTTAVHLTRRIPAPREEVFRAWTEPELVAGWFGPAYVSKPSVEMDVRVGGRYRIATKPPGGWTAYVVGTYLEVEPPERLVYTWNWEGALPGFGVEESRVTVLFRDLGGETEVSLTHERLYTRRLRSFHRWGWSHSLAGLDRVVAAKPR